MDSVLNARIFSPEELRHLTIEVLTEPTERDMQSRIGASNLGAGCDYCLACNFLGDQRDTPITGRAWLGRILGTALHLLLEYRIKARIKRLHERFLGSKVEHHVDICVIEGYGPVGGSIDLLLSLLQIVDWKSSTRKKIALLIDFIEISQGRDPIFGRSHQHIKLSEREYAKAMESMSYTVTNYYGQQQLYMHGSGARAAALIFIAKDGTGWFDNPAGDRYDDPKATHDVYVLPFAYNEQYALDLIARGQRIWSALEAGATPGDFARHPQCFPCSLDQQEALKAQAAGGEPVLATVKEAA